MQEPILSPNFLEESELLLFAPNLDFIYEIAVSVTEYATNYEVKHGFNSLGRNSSGRAEDVKKLYEILYEAAGYSAEQIQQALLGQAAFSIAKQLATVPINRVNLYLKIIHHLENLKTGGLGKSKLRESIQKILKKYSLVALSKLDRDEAWHYAHLAKGIMLQQKQRIDNLQQLITNNNMKLSQPNENEISVAMPKTSETKVHIKEIEGQIEISFEKKQSVMPIEKFSSDSIKEKIETLNNNNNTKLEVDEQNNIKAADDIIKKSAENIRPLNNSLEGETNASSHSSSYFTPRESRGFDSSSAFFKKEEKTEILQDKSQTKLEIQEEINSDLPNPGI